MGDDLTTDQFDALAQIAEGVSGRPSACVARNAKQLIGLKYATHSKDGRFILTDKGRQTLFVKSCIDGLRAVSLDSSSPLKSDVVTFLGKKGHIVAQSAGSGFDITSKGKECLADIDARKS